MPIVTENLWPASGSNNDDCLILWHSYAHNRKMRSALPEKIRLLSA